MSALKIKSGIYNFYLGSTHKDFSVQQSLSYINGVFDDYLKYLQIDSQEIRNKNILEIGPGDNLGVALKFIANGAKKVVCLDRVYSARNHRQQYNIYSALRNELDTIMKSDFDSALLLKDGRLFFNDDKIKYIYGFDISDAGSLLKDEKFDFIVSRAVLEHVYNIDTAFSMMNKLLKKDGYVAHKVDLRDHEMFSLDGFNPLAFLTIPNPIWRHMTKHSGKPNRKRFDYYKKKLEEMSLTSKIWITHLITQKDEILPHKGSIMKNRDYGEEDLAFVNRIRPKLCTEFRSLSDEGLLIGGIFIIGKKDRV